jgi:hypothetical protein
VTVATLFVPPSPENDPVPPLKVNVSAKNGDTLPAQVNVLGVKVRSPLMLKVPESDVADAFPQKTAHSNTARPTLR